ncbi:hypothetical protein [Streptomyces sp. NPDC051636]|uniref:hypothetical protein n=1 Tax=Streptomyces sp. NPDC051636 TaxID=3365663 RepID=UPI00379FF75D
MPRSAMWEKAAYVAAPGTIVLGLLYYFGSVYTQAYYSSLGVLSSDLQLSVQSIVAQSPQAIFLPLCLLMVCGLVVLLVLGRVGHLLALPEYATRRRKVTRWLLRAGLGLMLLGLPAFYSDQLLIPVLPQGWATAFVPPLVMGLGATLAFFAVQLRLGQSRHVSSQRDRTGDRLWLAAGALLIGLLSLSLFYDMARYVNESGRGAAIRVADGGYRRAPQVLVHSRMPLPTNAPDIVLRDFGENRGPFRYQYQGFRIVAKAPNRFYLVSYASRYANRVMVVLPDDGNIWLEVKGE